jgi:predicted transcriptional regulator
MNTYNALLSYGFSETEAKIYHFLIEHLEANVAQIHRDIPIPRATIYKALTKLEAMGFVSRFKKNKIITFTVTNVNKMETDLKERLEIVQAATPLLKEMVFTADARPNVQLLVGADGLKDMWEDIYNTCKALDIKEVNSVGSTGPRSVHRKYFPTWEGKMKRLRCTIKIAVPELVRQYGSHEPYVNKYYPDDFKTGGTFTIYGNKVAIGNFGDKPHATIIESPIIAAQFMQMWKMIWFFSKD